MCSASIASSNQITSDVFREGLTTRQRMSGAHWMSSDNSSNNVGRVSGRSDSSSKECPAATRYRLTTHQITSESTILLNVMTSVVAIHTPTKHAFVASVGRELGPELIRITKTIAGIMIRQGCTHATRNACRVDYSFRHHIKKSPAHAKSSESFRHCIGKAPRCISLIIWTSDVDLGRF